MIELIEERQENSKTLDLGNGKRQLTVSIGAIHYKDNYANKSEQWKDIDLTWEGNRITKAPYELTRDGNKLTIRDKKSGEVSTIELLGDVGFDTELEVVPEYSRVKFTRILKSDKAPVEARFRVTGKIPFRVRASDAEGELPVVSSLKGGILTESLGLAERPIKYPVRIDPTWQVGASTDDAHHRLTTDWFSLTYENVVIGYETSTIRQYGSGMRFTNITIAQGAIIDDGTNLILRASLGKNGTVSRSRVSAEDVDDAVTFADNAAAFDTRWAARTTARVDWSGIPAWTVDQEDADTTSPEIKTVIKEIVDRGGWNSGQDIVIFWEDFEDRSDSNANCARYAYSWDGNSSYAPKLVIVYTEVVTFIPKIIGII